MAKLKPTNQNVEKFISSIEDENVRNDCLKLTELMSQITNQPPVIWADNMVGFGSYHYKYESGHEGDAFLIGFSPRKPKTVIYLLIKRESQEDIKLLEKLGKHKATKACLYIKNLSDINVEILKKMLVESVKSTKEIYPDN